eukprot:tig00001094_g7011.t1
MDPAASSLSCETNAFLVGEDFLCTVIARDAAGGPASVPLEYLSGSWSYVCPASPPDGPCPNFAVEVRSPRSMAEAAAATAVAAGPGKNETRQTWKFKAVYSFRFSMTLTLRRVPFKGSPSETLTAYAMPDETSSWACPETAVRARGRTIACTLTLRRRVTGGAEAVFAPEEALGVSLSEPALGELAVEHAAGYARSLVARFTSGNATGVTLLLAALDGLELPAPPRLVVYELADASSSLDGPRGPLPRLLNASAAPFLLLAGGAPLALTLRPRRDGRPVIGGAAQFDLRLTSDLAEAAIAPAARRPPGARRARCRGGVAAAAAAVELPVVAPVAGPLASAALLVHERPDGTSSLRCSSQLLQPATAAAATCTFEARRAGEPILADVAALALSLAPATAAFAGPLQPAPLPAWAGEPLSPPASIAERASFAVGTLEASGAARVRVEAGGRLLAELLLVVLGAPDATSSVAPAALALRAGGAASATLTPRRAGAAGAIALSLAGAPAPFASLPITVYDAPDATSSFGANCGGGSGTAAFPPALCVPRSALAFRVAFTPRRAGAPVLASAEDLLFAWRPLGGLAPAQPDAAPTGPPPSPARPRRPRRELRGGRRAGPRAGAAAARQRLPPRPRPRRALGPRPGGLLYAALRGGGAPLAALRVFVTEPPDATSRLVAVCNGSCEAPPAASSSSSPSSRAPATPRPSSTARRPAPPAPRGRADGAGPAGADLVLAYSGSSRWSRPAAPSPPLEAHSPSPPAPAKPAPRGPAGGGGAPLGRRVRCGARGGAENPFAGAPLSNPVTNPRLPAPLPRPEARGAAGGGGGGGGGGGDGSTSTIIVGAVLGGALVAVVAVGAVAYRRVRGRKTRTLVQVVQVHPATEPVYGTPVDELAPRGPHPVLATAVEGPPPGHDDFVEPFVGAPARAPAAPPAPPPPRASGAAQGGGARGRGRGEALGALQDLQDVYGAGEVVQHPPLQHGVGIREYAPPPRPAPDPAPAPAPPARAPLRPLRPPSASAAGTPRPAPASASPSSGGRDAGRGQTRSALSFLGRFV